MKFRRPSPLEIIAFTTGFALMAFELAAARVLAPSIGSSTYVWTSVIGVIIAALSVGYWVGGQLADKRRASGDVVLLLILSSLAILLTLLAYPFILDWVVTQFTDPRLQAVKAAALLFAPASFLIGTISPYLAKLNISKIDSAGSRVASLSALNSVGGIVGTFTTGFILFGYIGARETFVLVALLLLVSSWLLVWHYRLKQRIAISLILILLMFLPPPTTPGVINIDTASSHYQIVTYPTRNGAATGLLTGPGGIQSMTYADGSPGLLAWYTQEIARLVLIDQPTRILMLGGGAFTLPQHLAEQLPDSQINVVEIDPELKNISEQYFHYRNPSNVQLIFNDARTFLNNSTDTYDAIIVDVYSDDFMPFSLMTAEFGLQLGSRTAEDGKVYVNVIAGLKDDACEQVMFAIDAAYRQKLPYAAYSNGFDYDIVRGNHILVYSRSEITASGLRQLPKTNQQPYTDNYMPAERLNFTCKQ